MKNLSSLASLLSAAALSTGAFAGLVDVRYTGLGENRTVTVTSPGVSGSVHAGQMLLTASNSADPSAFANGNYIGFCADLYQYANGSTRQYNTVSVAQMPDHAPMGAAAAAAVTNLYAFAGGQQYGTNADYACAFQLAIWETIFDSGSALNVGQGQFQAAGYSSTVGNYLATLLAAASTPGSADLVGLQSGAYQDYIVQVPGPGSLALLGMGGLMGLRRRRA